LGWMHLLNGGLLVAGSRRPGPARVGAGNQPGRFTREQRLAELSEVAGEPSRARAEASSATRLASIAAHASDAEQRPGTDGRPLRPGELVGSGGRCEGTPTGGPETGGGAGSGSDADRAA